MNGNPRSVDTDGAPRPLEGAPYSQAIVRGDLVFVSGQVAIDPRSGQFVTGGIEEQTTQVMHNTAAILAAAGSSLDHILKTTVFLAQFSDWTAMNEVYARFVSEPMPARSAIQVGLLEGALVEMETIAHLPDDPSRVG